MTQKVPSIDVLFTISDAWLLPYLKNACASIFAQRYPTDKVRVFVSCSTRKKDADISGISSYCKEVGATFVHSVWREPAFNISRAYNAITRKGSADAVAFFDADVVFQLDLFQFIVGILQRNQAVVVSVGRCDKLPDSAIYKIENEKMWRDVAHQLDVKEGGIGNIVVPRSIVNKVQGFDERFYGWGAEDTDFYERVKRMVKVHRLDSLGFPASLHQYHRTTPTKGTKFTWRNRRIFRGNQ